MNGDTLITFLGSYADNGFMTFLESYGINTKKYFKKSNKSYYHITLKQYGLELHLCNTEQFIDEYKLPPRSNVKTENYSNHVLIGIKFFKPYSEPFEIAPHPIVPLFSISLPGKKEDLWKKLSLSIYVDYGNGFVIHEDFLHKGYKLSFSYNANRRFNAEGKYDAFEIWFSTLDENEFRYNNPYTY